MRWFESHNRISWTITIFGAIAIFYISSITFAPGAIPRVNFLSILYHFCAFFFFAIFLMISSTQGKRRYTVFILAFILAILYGILDELHQYFVPGRASTIFDIGIDSLGVLFASMIYWIRIEYKKKFK